MISLQGKPSPYPALNTNRGYDYVLDGNEGKTKKELDKRFFLPVRSKIIGIRCRDCLVITQRPQDIRNRYCPKCQKQHLISKGFIIRNQVEAEIVFSD